MAHLDFERPLAELEQRISEFKAVAASTDGLGLQVRKLEERAERLRSETYRDLSPWQRVQLSRHPDRPHFLDYHAHLFEDFVELHGDRVYGDDAAIVAGLARFEGRSVAVIGQQKGRTTKEKLKRSFGMAHPEGYRKACRVMALAEQFGRPVMTFIDTSGAYPGVGAEERGQAEAIGRSLLVMSRLRVPIIATVISEGGSGGALALGLADRVLMMEHATYSVITPEGCAAILWRDVAMAPEAAEQLKLLAPDALRLGVVDALVDEPLGGAHRDPGKAAQSLRAALASHLRALTGVSSEQLIDGRYARFRGIGELAEEP